MTSATLPALASWRIPVAIVLCVTNAALAGLLLMQHHGESAAAAAVDQVCGEGTPDAPSGCNAVAQSAYSRFAGIPLAAYGLFFASAVATLLALAAMADPDTRASATILAFLGVGLAFAIDLVLLGVLAFAIKAICWFCVATYAVNAAVLLVLLPVRRSLAMVRGLFSDGAGRLLLTSWVIASLALAGGVYAAESGLSARQGARAATMLGVPATPPKAVPNVPVVTGPEGSDLRRAQEEAKAATERANKLQAILDNPEQVNLYYAQKAEQEYESGPSYPLKLEGVPRKGPDTAPIKVTEFSDFMCPHCRNIAGAFDSYLPQSGGRIMIFFKNYPLDTECNPNLKQQVHVGACLLARGGLCANEQGKFWPYHNRVFAQEIKSAQRADLLKMANEAGLDLKVLEACLDTSRTRDRLAAEIAEATAAKVVSTPTLFIDGKKLPRIQDFTTTLEKEAAKRGLPPLPGGSR